MSSRNAGFRSMELTDQIDALHRRAEELEYKQTLASLMSLLKERKDLLPGIVRHLQGKGIEVIKATKLGKKRVKEEEEEGAATKDEEGSQSQKIRKSQRVGDTNPANWMPHCYTRLDNTKAPVKFARWSSRQPGNSPHKSPRASPPMASSCPSSRPWYSVA